MLRQTLKECSKTFVTTLCGGLALLVLYKAINYYIYVHVAGIGTVLHAAATF